MPAEDADAIWRSWMTDVLSAAVERFGLVITGPPAWGWHNCSAGVPTERSQAALAEGGH